jgi:hypothetical protein
MTTIVLMWALYLLFAGCVAGVARMLRRRIPPANLLAFIGLPILFLLSAFTSERTIVPVDHALSLPPWSYTHPGIHRHNIWLNDAAQQFVPWAKAARLSWKEGALPLRHRWNGAGMALAANSQSSAFFPPLLLSFALPLAASFNLLAAIKLFLALCGTWLWLRELGASRGASTFGAVAFSLSLTMTAWLLFPHTGVLCLWPWALFAIERLRGEDWRPGFWIATAVFTMWVLGGHPESAASAAAWTLVWLLARGALGNLPDKGRLAKRLSLSAAAAVGLSCFLLLPQTLAILASSRIAHWGVFWAPHLSLAPHGPIWVNGLLTPLFPRLLGDAISSPMIEGRMASYPEMGLGYFGIVGWACALLILRPGSKRPAAERALLAPLIVGWAFAIGQWPFGEILSLLPALKLIFPIRLFSWIALAGAAIAAFELDRLSEDLRARRTGVALAPVFCAVALALLAVAAFFRVRGAHAAKGGLAGQLEWLTLSVVALVVFALACRAATRREFPLFLSLTLIGGTELYLQGTRLYRFGSAQLLFPMTPALDWLAARPKPFRVLGEAATVFPNSNVHAGLEEVRTHDPVERRDYVEFLDATAGYPPAEYFKQIGDRNAAVLDFLGVRYFIGLPGQPAPGERWKPAYSGADATIYENARALPRVFAPLELRLVQHTGRREVFGPVNSTTSFREHLGEMKALANWRSVAFLLAPRGAHSWTEGPQPSSIEVSEYREWTNSASFSARNGSDREVVLVASLVQDGGWSVATEEGTRLATTHANGPFLAIAVPPGQHRIRMRYASPGFRTGSAVTVATALALAAVAFWTRSRSKGAET